MGGIDHSTMRSFSDIAGYSMAYSAKACVFVCLGASTIRCLPHWKSIPTAALDPASTVDCGTGVLTGAGFGVALGWDICYTEELPDSLYKETGPEMVKCPSSSWFR